jgi:hypothetical protein
MPLKTFQFTLWRKNRYALGGYERAPSTYSTRGVDGFNAAQRLADLFEIIDWKSTPTNNGRPTYIIRNETPEI